MYSRLQMVKKYISYYLRSSNGRGHGMHSPFVYDFITRVLNDHHIPPSWKEIEDRRKALLKDSRLIEVEDFGAGSQLVPLKVRRVKDIAAHSLKSKKYAQLLSRIVKYYEPGEVIEMGTSLGITTMYMATASHRPSVFTMEGSGEVAAIAQQGFKKAGLENIYLRTGPFDQSLPEISNKPEKVEFLFVDGNHRKAPTLEYFKYFLSLRAEQSIFIFDDIHWSKGMEQAWKEIKSHPEVLLTIDLFFIGLVFFNPKFKVKQHFTIRF